MKNKSINQYTAVAKSGANWITNKANYVLCFHKTK